MDSNEPGKEILNADLAMSNLDIPMIPLRVPNMKKSKACSQVLN